MFSSRFSPLDRRTGLFLLHWLSSSTSPSPPRSTSRIVTRTPHRADEVSLPALSVVFHPIPPISLSILSQAIVRQDPSSSGKASAWEIELANLDFTQ